MLAASTEDWQRFVKEEPGFTRQMINVADFLYKTEAGLLKCLNGLLKKAELPPVNHATITYALATTQGKHTSAAEKA